MKLIGNLHMTKTRAAINQQLKNLNSTIKITPTINKKGIQSATKQAVNAAQQTANKNTVHINFDIDKKRLMNQIRILGQQNSKLFNNRNMTLKYNQLLNSANTVKTTQELKNVGGQLSAFKTELVATGNAGLNLSDKFAQSNKKYASFFSGAIFICTLSNQLRNAWTEAKTLDSALVDLQKVSGEITDRDALYQYFDSVMGKAQDLNVKVNNLIYAITEFKKLGYSLSDAEVGGEWATVLSNVGDIDIDTAIGSIKTAIASFEEIGGYGNDQLDKKMEAFTDLINEMSNKYSIDAEGLAEAIRISAGTLTEAHTSVEQAATMFATANRFYNDPSYLGNTAKIGSLRLRASASDGDAVKELEKMGEETDNLIMSTSKLREKLLGLTGVDIMLDNNTFKGYYDQLYEISQVIDDLSDTSRAQVLETLFGKSRAAGGAALLSGMKESVDAYETAINSAGSATREYETWMQSADASVQRFSNSLTQIYQSIINGNTVRDLANLGSTVLDLANNFGIVESTLKGLILIGIGKFITGFGATIILATKQVEQYGTALQAVQKVQLGGSLGQNFKQLKAVAQATMTLTDAQLKNVLASKTLTQQDRIRILQLQGMTKEMATAKLAEMGLTQTTNAQTAANTGATASIFSLKAAMVGLGATIKNLFLSNPIGIALMGISLVITSITSAVEKHNQKLEEARQKAKELADEANDFGDSIAELAQKYLSLSEAVKTDETQKELLIQTQQELLKKLQLEGEAVDTLIVKYGSLDEAIKQVSIDSLRNARIDLIGGVSSAEEELKSIGKSYKEWKDLDNGNVFVGDPSSNEFKALKKAGLLTPGWDDMFALIGDNKTVEGILENYDKLNEALRVLDEAFTSEELTQNKLYKAILDRRNEMKEAAENYRNSISNVNENVAQELTLIALKGNELPKTSDEFEVFKQELIDTAKASNDFIGTEEDIINAVTNYLFSVPEFKGFFSTPLKDELDEVDTLLDQVSSISKLKFTKDKWNDILNLDDENDENYAGLKEAKTQLQELAEQGKLTIEAFKETPGYESILAYFGYDETEISRMIDHINSLVESTQQLSVLQSKVNNIGSNFTSKKENGSISAEELNNTYNQFEIENWSEPNIEVWERYKQVAASSTSTIKEFKQASDDLATSLVNEGNYLANVTEETKEQYVELLKNMGVKNAEDVVNHQLIVSEKNLAIQKEFVTAKSKDLADATADEIEEFVKEMGYSDATAIALKQLALEKLLVNRTTLDFSSDIKAIADLVGSINGANSALRTLAAMKDYKGTIPPDVWDKVKQGAQEETDNALGNNVEIDFSKYLPSTNSGSGGSGGSGSGSGNSTKDFNNQIDWTTQSIDRLQDKVDDLNEKLSNTKGWNDQIKIIKQLNKELKNLKNGYEKQEKIYNKQYQKQLNQIKNKKLRESVRQKIESGKEFSIENFIDKNIASDSTGTREKLYNQINDAIEWYNK